MSPHPKEHPERSDLVRGLGLWAATAVVIGDTIGSGIFLVSSDMARASGSATLVFAAWILGGLIVLFGAFCYAELGAAFPKAGGPYLYLNRGLGPLWGFLFGWMSSFLERPVAMAALAAGFLRFLGFLFPVVATPLFTGHVGRYAYPCRSCPTDRSTHIGEDPEFSRRSSFAADRQWRLATHTPHPASRPRDQLEWPSEATDGSSAK